MPLKAIDERKYQAQRYKAFSFVHMFSTSTACSAVQVSWKKSPGIMLSEMGDSATMCENKTGNTR